VTVSVTVARNADEAERLKRGEDVTVVREEGAEASAEAVAAAEAFLDPEAAAARAREESPTDAPEADAKPGE